MFCLHTLVLPLRGFAGELVPLPPVLLTRSTFEKTVVLPTAAAVTDPTAPHTFPNIPIDLSPSVPRHEVPFIDHMTVALVPRN